MRRHNAPPMALPTPLGVAMDPATHLYRATIVLPGGASRSVGLFGTAEQAAVAHDSYTRYYHADSTEYVRLNYPHRDEPLARVQAWKRRPPPPAARLRGVQRKLTSTRTPYWYAVCRLAGRRTIIGSFRTETDAARAIDSYRREQGYPAVNYPALPNIDYRALCIPRHNAFAGQAARPLQF